MIQAVYDKLGKILKNGQIYPNLEAAFYLDIYKIIICGCKKKFYSSHARYLDYWHVMHLLQDDLLSIELHLCPIEMNFID